MNDISRRGMLLLQGGVVLVALVAMFAATAHADTLFTPHADTLFSVTAESPQSFVDGVWTYNYDSGAGTFSGGDPFDFPSADLLLASATYYPNLNDVSFELSASGLNTATPSGSFALKGDYGSGTQTLFGSSVLKQFGTNGTDYEFLFINGITPDSHKDFVVTYHSDFFKATVAAVPSAVPTPKAATGGAALLAVIGVGAFAVRRRSMAQA